MRCALPTQMRPQNDPAESRISGQPRQRQKFGREYRMKFSNLSIQTKLVIGAGVLFAASMCGIVFGGTSLMYGTAGNEAESRARALLGQYGELAAGQMGGIISLARGVSASVEGVIAEGT